jgi:hypothetical protein
MNAEHVPLNNPINILGIEAGTPTLNTLYRVLAPNVSETSKNEFATLDIPLLVMTVVGNHTAKAIKKLLADIVVGNTTKTKGTHAVDGIGPINLTSGLTQ